MTALAAFIIIILYLTDFKMKRLFTNHYALLIILGLAVKLAATFIQFGFDTDIICFKSWSEAVFAGGFGKFYTSATFTDYPPGYMYILYVVGAIRAFLDLPYDSTAFTLLVKLPAIIFDIAIGMFIYFAAAKKTKANYAFFLGLAFVLNPAVIVDSSVWGQVDSSYTLFVLASVYFLAESKQLASFLLFTAAVLIKPQALIFTPVFIFSAVDKLLKNHFNKRSVTIFLRDAALSVLLLFLGVLPFAPKFDFTPVIKQYGETLSSYSYATVNAYNFYAFIGANWKPAETPFMFLTFSMWGIIFIDVIVILGFYLLMRNRSKANYFFMAALFNILTFMFSIKMHERYVYPVMALLLMAYVYKREKKFLLLFAGFSMTLFINCVDILNVFSRSSHGDYSVIALSMPFVSLVNLVLTGIAIYTAFSSFKRPSQTPANILDNPVPADHVPADVTPAAFAPTNPDEVPEYVNTSHNFLGIPDAPDPSDKVYELEDNAPLPKMERLDYILLAVVTVIYAIVAFTNLGDTKFPQTLWKPVNGQEAVVDFGEPKMIAHFVFLNGPKNDERLELYTSNDNIDFKFDQEVKCDAVFTWGSVMFNKTTRYVKIVSRSGSLMLLEAGFKGIEREVIPIRAMSGTALELFDEQALIPTDQKDSYMNNMYFDEIYHGRTAFEFLNAMSVYEWTHPPMGKNIIAMGIKLFGMTPFGWRFAGTLFGVFMVPVFYIFAKKMFGKAYWALFATLLFTFDFMHFVQTRLTTIDTYVTIFIMCMFFFMYVYSNMSFYKTRLINTLVPLFLSGLFMGLAVACKWQGVYAASGLAVVFFMTLYRRFVEYRRCEGTSAFPKYTAITLASCVLFFIVIPVLIYVSSYVLYLRAPFSDGLKTILENQTSMFAYHSNLKATHPFSSSWWQWPLDIRPVYLYAKTITTTVRRGFATFGNPFVWWCGLVAFFYSIYAVGNDKANDAAVSRRKDHVFLFIAYAAQMLPWIPITRTTYIYHYFPAVPFLVLMITCFFKDYVYNLGKKGKIITIGYAVAVIVLFAMFYPVLTGIPINVWYVEHILKWLPSWQLI